MYIYIIVYHVLLRWDNMGLHFSSKEVISADPISLAHISNIYSTSHMYAHSTHSDISHYSTLFNILYVYIYNYIYIYMQHIWNWCADEIYAANLNPVTSNPLVLSEHQVPWTASAPGPSASSSVRTTSSSARRELETTGPLHSGMGRIGQDWVKTCSCPTAISKNHETSTKIVLNPWVKGKFGALCAGIEWGIVLN